MLGAGVRTQRHWQVSAVGLSRRSPLLLACLGACFCYLQCAPARAAGRAAALSPGLVLGCTQARPASAAAPGAPPPAGPRAAVARARRDRERGDRERDRPRETSAERRERIAAWNKEMRGSGGGGGGGGGGAPPAAGPPGGGYGPPGGGYGAPGGGPPMGGYGGPPMQGGYPGGAPAGLPPPPGMMPPQ